MKLLINTSNIYIGGALQVALSFLDELRKRKKENEYHIFLSKAVNDQIDKNLFSDNFYFYMIEKSPSILRSRKMTIKQLDSLESKIRPDIVFSIFGPTYWKPSAKHLMGFADGWVYNPKGNAFKKLPLSKKIKNLLLINMKRFQVKRDANYYVLETKDAKNKFIKYLNINIKKVFVVGNTYSSIFNDPNYLDPNSEFYLKMQKKEKNEFRLLLIAHNYPHKNLSVIKEVISYLRNSNIKFVLTIKDDEFNKLFRGVENSIINLGPIKHENCPSVYSQCDALFFPTLLETFSASYPEAMKMKKPILTSNYSFATDICKDAALYFDPLNPKEIAEKITKLIANKKLQTELIDKGLEQLSSFETAQSRALKYLDILENLKDEKR
jgi:glycosyltransferase involved in cell wall biosynthesis